MCRPCSSLLAGGLAPGPPHSGHLPPFHRCHPGRVKLSLPLYPPPRHAGPSQVAVGSVLCTQTRSLGVAGLALSPGHAGAAHAPALPRPAPAPAALSFVCLENSHLLFNILFKHQPRPREISSDSHQSAFLLLWSQEPGAHLPRRARVSHAAAVSGWPGGCPGGARGQALCRAHLALCAPRCLEITGTQMSEPECEGEDHRPRAPRLQGEGAGQGTQCRSRCQRRCLFICF